VTKNKKTVDDLIAELEEKAPAPSKPPQCKPHGRQTRPTVPASPGFGGRLLLAVVLLATGFVAGWTVAGLRKQLSGAVAAKPGRETRQTLLAAGWQEADQGVFTRRCKDNCRMPVLYGGDIRVEFDVVDGRGQVIDRIKEISKGRQGERLQIVLESQNSAARRFVLQSFSAKARLD
jgi:hypothetical protein